MAGRDPENGSAADPPTSARQHSLRPRPTSPEGRAFRFAHSLLRSRQRLNLTQGRPV